MQLGRMRLAWIRKTIGLAFTLSAGPALANPALVVDVDSGKVLYQSQPTANWYPASLTKLMTVYVALHAVRDGRITMDTPFVVSAHAASMPPTKMGFRPGVQVTLDNALKMLMVKSPNDIAITIAEGVSGSVEAFADEMNAAAARLGLKESHFVNPNGLPDERQVSSARDMAMIGRALLKEFPEENDIFGIGELQLGNQIIMTHNGLIGRYPGADGMKTGFTCAAGFNVVASATQGGRRLIVVVLGAPTARERTAEAAALFDSGFAQSGGGLGSLFGGGLAGLESLEGLPSPGVNRAPDMHGEVCSGRRAAMAASELEELTTPISVPASGATRGLSMFSASTATAHMTPRALAAMAPAHFDPVVVFVGPKPGWTGAVVAARPSDPAIDKAATAAPVAATAYAPSDKAAAEEAPPLAADTAPLALHAAVKPAATKAFIERAAKPRSAQTASLVKMRSRRAVVSATGHGAAKDDKAAAPPPKP